MNNEILVDTFKAYSFEKQLDMFHRHVRENPDTLVDTFSLLPYERQLNIIYQHASETPANFQLFFSIHFRASADDDYIQETLSDSKPPGLTMDDFATDDKLEEGEIHEGPVFHPGRASDGTFAESDLKRLNSLSSVGRKREIAKMNLSPENKKRLKNKLLYRRTRDRRRALNNERRNINHDNNGDTMI